MEARTTMTPAGLAAHLGAIIARNGRIEGGPEFRAVGYAADVLAERGDLDAEATLRSALGSGRVDDDALAALTASLLVQLDAVRTERDELRKMVGENAALRALVDKLRGDQFAAQPITLPDPGQPVDVPVGADHPGTSRVAAETVRHSAAMERATILADLIEHGPANAGLVAERAGLASPNQTGARFVELRDQGWIERVRWPDETYVTKPTPSGRPGIVHQLTISAASELVRQHGSLGFAVAELRKMGRGKLGPIG